MNIYTSIKTDHFSPIRYRIIEIMRHRDYYTGYKIVGVVPDTDLIYEAEIFDNGIEITSIHTKQEHLEKLKD